MSVFRTAYVYVRNVFAGLLCENEIAINGFEWTKISFPEFEELFAKLK